MKYCQKWLHVCGLVAVDLAADESSTVNGGDYAGDRESRASSADLSELTGATLTSEADDRESYLTEDDELDTPVKPYLRLGTGHIILLSDHSDNQTGDCWRSCFYRCWQSTLEQSST